MGFHTWTGGEKVFYNESAGWGAATLIESTATLGPFTAGDKTSSSSAAGGTIYIIKRRIRGLIRRRRVRLGKSARFNCATRPTPQCSTWISKKASGFTATSDPGLAGPWLYAGPISQFEIHGDTLAADRYVPDTPGSGTIIDIDGTDLNVVLLTSPAPSHRSWNE